MTTPISATYSFTARERTSTDRKQVDAPLRIVCEPFGKPVGKRAIGTLSIRLNVRTNLEKASVSASTPQANVKGLSQLEASGDAFA